MDKHCFALCTSVWFCLEDIENARVHPDFKQQFLVDAMEESELARVVPAHPGHRHWHRRPASQSPPGRSTWRLHLMHEDTSPLPSRCLDSSHAGRAPAPRRLPEAVLALGCSNLAGPPSAVASGTSTLVSQPCLRGDSHTKRTVGLGAVLTGFHSVMSLSPGGPWRRRWRLHPDTRSATSGRCWQGRHHHVRPWACTFRTRSHDQRCF